ncbi:hypothetical protein ACQ4PT_015822 [Festuca glaucescens]
MLSFGSVPRLTDVNLTFRHSDEPLDFLLGNAPPSTTNLVLRFTAPSRWIFPIHRDTPWSGLKRILVADPPWIWEVLWPRMLLLSTSSLEVLHIHVAHSDEEPAGEEKGWWMDGHVLHNGLWDWEMVGRPESSPWGAGRVPFYACSGLQDPDATNLFEKYGTDGNVDVFFGSTSQQLVLSILYDRVFDAGFCSIEVNLTRSIHSVKQQRLMSTPFARSSRTQNRDVLMGGIKADQLREAHGRWNPALDYSCQSWIDFLEDEDSLFLSKNSDIYVRLDSDGTLSAAKLGGCGTLLWSARHSWQQNSDSMKQKSHSKIKTLVLTTIAIVLGLFLMLFWIRRKRMERPLSCNGALIVFSEAHIKKATKSFSEKLGEGGLGCVFKGELPGFSLVAVKKLKSIAQGEKQFRAEVQTIGMIHHINLVRLFGFCVQGRTRLLIYEYMENGSLNSHLFSKKSAKLTWDLRYHIALGTARGLAYLHEECKECIIHCDMKPDNILLDAEFCPKIADFGMAKLLGRDFSRALTTMRGTIGYLAPEWISGLPITHKADVYSYGMMLLEIISGRRNAEKIREGKYTYFPIFAAIKVNEGDAISLLDPRLESQADIEQLNRVCRIACWCIQDAEDHRPMMRQVVHMLESVMEVEIPPIPRSLQNYVGMEDCSYSADADSSL